MSRQWNDDLRRRMEQYEAPAPDGLFDDIMSALPAHAEPVAPRGRAEWPRRIAIAAAIAIAVAAGYLTLITPMPIADDVVATAEEAELSPSRAEEAATDTQPLLADASAEQSSAPQMAAKHPAQKKVTGTTTTPTESAAPKISEFKGEIAPKKPASKKSAPEKTAPRQKATPQPQQNTSPRGTSHTSREKLLASTTPKRGNAGRLSMGLHAAGITIGQNKQATQQVFMVSSALYGVRQDEIGGGTSTDVVLHDQERSIATERHHRLPVRVGLTLRYNLSKRWAVESGVTYTQLSSETTMGNKASHYDEHTTLHYIGVPLNAVYNIWQSRRVMVYASAGVMVEKAVDGTLRTDYFLNDSKINAHRQDISVRPLQWSVNAAAGVQYNFLPWMAIYAEPSIGYHFDNGTDVETLYNERPLDFNLGVGLRFTLR